MTKIDTHIHGKYSSDSILDYRQLCQKAIKKNYQVIAFTEHYDLIDTELMEYGLLPSKRYFKELDIVKKEFPELEIIAGLEIGEPHIVMDFAKRLLKDMQPEYIIGSLHVLKTGKNVSMRMYSPLPEKAVRQYYEENLEMVQKGGFDTLGHLGIYKRSMECPDPPDESHVYHIIDEIFREMIKKDICLEINSSGFKTRFNNHIPDPKILSRYQKLGGELITICSDSHDLELFDKFYKKTLDSLRDLKFHALYWRNRGSWNSINIGGRADEKL